MYPLKFKPILKERLWGGSKLSDVLGKSTPDGNVGESWEISAVEGDVSVVWLQMPKKQLRKHRIKRNPEKW